MRAGWPVALNPVPPLAVQARLLTHDTAQRSQASPVGRVTDWLVQLVPPLVVAAMSPPPPTAVQWVSSWQEMPVTPTGGAVVVVHVLPFVVFSALLPATAKQWVSSGHEIPVGLFIAPVWFVHVPPPLVVAKMLVVFVVAKQWLASGQETLLISVADEGGVCLCQLAPPSEVARII